MDTRQQTLTVTGWLLGTVEGVINIKGGLAVGSAKWVISKGGGHEDKSRPSTSGLYPTGRVEAITHYHSLFGPKR